MKFTNPWATVEGFVDLGPMVCERGEYVEMYCFPQSGKSWAIGARYGDEGSQYISGGIYKKSFEGSWRNGYPIFEAYKKMIRMGLEVAIPQRAELLEDFRGLPAGMRFFIRDITYGLADCIALEGDKYYNTNLEKRQYKIIEDDWTKPFVYEESEV